MIDIIEPIKREINNPKPEVSGLMFATRINIA
jgi:hypothetical protein